VVALRCACIVDPEQPAFLQDRDEESRLRHVGAFDFAAGQQQRADDVTGLGLGGRGRVAKPSRLVVMASAESRVSGSNLPMVEACSP
jgi:hypothetical protein